MKNKNLYEAFGCENKRQMLTLIRNKDRRVDDLLNYFEYSKGNIGNKNKTIGGLSTLKSYINAIEKPKDTKADLIYVDGYRRPILLDRTRIDDKENLIETIRKGVTSGASEVYLVVDPYCKNIDDYIQNFKDVTAKIQLNVVDVIHYDKNDTSIYSEERLEKKFSENLLEFHKENLNFKDYSKTKEYSEFTSFYAKENIKGMNMLKEVKEIKNLLKVGYQHNIQENFGFIAYNKDNEVIEIKEATIGGLDKSVVDYRTFLKDVLNIDNLKGVAIYHNHPSGTTSPSEADMGVTSRLANIFKDFNIEYFDHFIVGKEDVFSFADKIYGFESHNESYQDSPLLHDGAENFADWDYDM